MYTRETMRGRVRAQGPGLQAFTPEGERRWVGPEWSPTYPAGDATLAPGLVFLAADATWVVADVDAGRVRYARVTPGERAGTVEVRRVDPEHVEVTYDLTALSSSGCRDLQRFAADYPAMLLEWSRLIAADQTATERREAGGARA